MENHLIEFDKIEWVSPVDGLRFKAYKEDDKTIRLMELSDSYTDTDWCRHGHVAYILDGHFIVRFEDHSENFKKGDTVFIAVGEENKHIAYVPKGEHLIMLSLFQKFPGNWEKDYAKMCLQH